MGLTQKVVALCISFLEHQKKVFSHIYNGVITAAIFWGTESVFYFVYAATFARELGAIIGLSIGYFFKYKLDKKYVFQD